MKSFLIIVLLLIGVVTLSFFPIFANEYVLGLLIGIMGYSALASSWAMFSGPTRYISLATVAFYGVGAYTVAVLGEVLPFWQVLIVACLIGLLLSLTVGLATLRLKGMYFVIFTFGLAELVRQLITWYEVNVTGTLGRYIFIDIEAIHIFWLLLALTCISLLTRYFLNKSRLGIAINAIGDDEVVALHCGINVTYIKLTLFALSSVMITLAGAIQAPRWIYVEPSTVFNPTISFLTLIMALLGGVHKLWGPIFGVIPLFFLFEWLSANFPNHYSIILGLVFIVIVFLVPKGILELIDVYIKQIFKKGKSTGKTDSNLVEKNIAE